MLALRQLAGSFWKNNFFDDLFILRVGMKEKNRPIDRMLEYIEKIMLLFESLWVKCIDWNIGTNDCIKPKIHHLEEQVSRECIVLSICWNNQRTEVHERNFEVLWKLLDFSWDPWKQKGWLWVRQRPRY